MYVNIYNITDSINVKTRLMLLQGGFLLHLFCVLNYAVNIT